MVTVAAMRVATVAGANCLRDDSEGSDPSSLWERLFVVTTTFLFFFDFSSFSHRLSPTSDGQMCWPHWQSCRILPLPDGFPSSYANSYLFTAVFGVCLLTLWAVFRNKAKIYLPALAVLTAFKIFYHYFWHVTGMQNFEYFHLVPTLAFLINSKNRIWGAQVAWALCYFLASAVKISEAWLVGSYFSALSQGLPLMPNFSIPFVTQSLILFEIFASWALLTSKYRKRAFWAWTFFHVYSVILVGFHYPVRCIAMLWILFLPLIHPQVFSREYQSKPKALNGVMLLFAGVLVGMQMLPFLYEEDARSSLRFEGYGYNMFDANFQCFGKITVHKALGPPRVFSYVNQNSRFRCNPRLFLEKVHQRCENSPGSRVALELTKSINGGPFYRIVDLADACHVQFSLFGENDWILSDTARLIGYPTMNAVTGTLSQDPVSHSIVSAKPVIFLTDLQQFIQDNLRFFKLFYLLIWFGALGWTVRRVWYVGLKNK